MPRPAAMLFDLEDATHRGHRGLLLASISESASKQGPLALAALGQLPGQLGQALSHLAKQSREPAKHLRSHRIAAPDLARAGAELERWTAVAGGMLLASVTQVAQRVAAARAAARRNGTGVPLHRSFKMPWGTRTGNRVSHESAVLFRNLVERGREYERNMDVRAAVQCYEEAARLVPDDLQVLCMAAKQWSDLTFYYDVRSDRERQLVNVKAIEYADRAVEVAPDSCHGYVASCISRGRLALFTDNRTKAKLAKEAQDAARIAITLDPDNDIAHHLMGRWHHQMAQVNMVLRALVRMVYGTALPGGTREQALESYRTATRLAPHKAIHRVEAGRLCLELGQRDEARRELETALRCEVDDINAWHQQMEAEQLLAKMDRRPWVQPSLVPPHARHDAPQAAAAAADKAPAGNEVPAASAAGGKGGA